MSHITLAQQGIEAADKRDWDSAITKLTVALKVSQNPMWLVTRSKALNGAGRYADSLRDAELAWHTALSRNKRELVAEANYRRAVAYNRLGQYANAVCCCTYAMRIHKGATPLLAKEDPKEAFIDAQGRCTLTTTGVKVENSNDEFNNPSKEDQSNMKPATEKVKQWRIASVVQLQALIAMEKLSEEDAARKITVSQKPEQPTLLDPTAKETEAPAAPKTTAPVASASTVTKPAPTAGPDTPVRLGDYQSDSSITVTIFSKGNDKSKLTVDILPWSVTLNPLVHPNGDQKEYTLDLWGEIDPSASKHTVTPSKIELTLSKKTRGKWPGVIKDKSEAQKTETAPLTRPSAPVAQPKAPEPEAKTAVEEGKEGAGTKSGPAYPTSSRGGPKNWDNLEGGDSDEESGVNEFFKKLYKGANPEQQRAMMKSFTESNGTSLSTNWEDVKDKRVETVPPNGVEAKPWDK